MIRTKDLIEFVQQDQDLYDAFEVELMTEIVARLERYDEMKEGIEKMIRDYHEITRDSSAVDKI